ncbi:MAG: PBP1A family penicillin-binding protein [Woeseiaceae bacterium]|nr:PBP1A family penicillin-binding protein [Woeseiaceae bacterium]NIP20719.1 PBP1A family penicillin-binding protein [Woeseiaceae bacterium]NIS89512.1 PBP1A family penicillin-binding protein [Woeseiaceae bacterium]
MLGLSITATIAGVAGVVGAYYYVAPSLPAAETIRDIPLQIPLRVFSRDGHLIAEFGERRRILVTYDEVPEHVVNAFIAAEDKRFWVHPGVDYRGLLRAFYQLITTGDVQAGGSTLTQQLARSYFLSLDRTVERKFKEASLAVRIEKEFTKEQIMALFLNKMFFGQRAYGVSAAAQVYFNKPLKDLSVAEAATLAGVLPAPSSYNPVRNVDLASRRRGYVLGRMLDIGYIDQEQFDEAVATPIESRLYGTAVELEAPYVAEIVRRDMLERFGPAYSTDGYQVVTTLDSRLQRAANYAVRNGLLEFTRRRGYRGPLGHFELTPDVLMTPFAEWPIEIRQSLEQYAPGDLTVALVIETSEIDNSAVAVTSGGSKLTIPWTGLSWAKPFIDMETTGPEPEVVGDVLIPGDVILIMPTAAGTWALAQAPAAQSALVAMDPEDGAITSLVGGFDFATSKYNRATQAFRQPGSAFKPFIYSAALEHGNTVATVILDAPIVISSSELEAVWRPINYSGRFYGPTRLREALVRSMNLVSVRLLLFETGFGNAINHIAKFGFGDAALIRNGSLALGGGNASPLDMVQGYSVFANGGHAVSPYVIDAIYGPDGDLLYRANPPVVCEPCEAEPDEDYVVEYDEDGNRIDEFPLDQMANVALEYMPDASTAPELFKNINSAERVITPQNAFLIQDLMRDVIRRGTGRRALVLGRRDLSGKTGTSNDQRDAWFGGFNSDMAAVVWVGYDDSLPLGPGEEGSRTALPIWIEYMRLAMKGVPENQMPMPDGIVSVKIDRETGCPARAGQSNTTFEYFREGHVPVCENVDELPDLFNDAAGADPDPDAPDDDETETLF